MKENQDEQLIDALGNINRLRSCKRMNKVDVLTVLDQVEEVVNWLLITNAEDTATALKVAELQRAQLSRMEAGSRKPAEITLHVNRYTPGNA